MRNHCPLIYGLVLLTIPATVVRQAPLWQFRTSDISLTMEQKVLHNDTNEQTPIQFADLIKQGDDVEIAELDKSGNVQRRWLHRSDNTIAIVSSTMLQHSLTHSTTNP